MSFHLQLQNLSMILSENLPYLQSKPCRCVQNSTFFCKVASVETWCFLKHSITALNDGKGIFPNTAAKMESRGT